MGSFDFHTNLEALTEHNGDLIAAGAFPEYVVKWDEKTSQWQPMNAGLDQWGMSLKSHNGQLHLGTFPGPGDAPGMYRWNGSAWELLGMATGSTQSIRAMIDHEGDLIAAGSFTAIGGAGARSVARWDGKSWQPINEGKNSSLGRLIEFQDGLYAGGSFTLESGAQGIAN